MDKAGKAVAREYLRVSKDRYGKAKSTSEQHDENVVAVADQGWELHPHPYRDDDRQASRFARKAREGFEELVTDLRDGSFGAEVLVLWESSRGSRKVGEWVTLIDLLEELGMSVFVTTHDRTYDPAIARDRKALLDDAVDSEYESAKSSERIRRSVKAAAHAGRVHGKDVYGYLRIYDEQTRQLKQIVPHPEQAPVVQEAARLLLSGEQSFYGIAKLFNERGIPPRRPSYKEHRQHLGWTMPAVRSMLTTPAYAGLRQYRGKVLEGVKADWPALIEREDWEKIAQIAQQRRGRTTQDWVAKHLLAGIAVCGVCGVAVRTAKQNYGRRKRNGEELPKPIDPITGEELPYPSYLSYACAGTPGTSVNGKAGSHVAMRKEHLDEMVVAAVLARLQRPDFLALSVQEGAGTSAERMALIEEIEGHQRYLEDVRQQAAERGRFDLLMDQEDRVQPLIAAAREKLERLAELDPTVLRLASAEGVRAAWEGMDIEEQRRVIRSMVRPVIGSPTIKGGHRDPKTGKRPIDYDRVRLDWRH